MVVGVVIVGAVIVGLLDEAEQVVGGAAGGFVGALADEDLDELAVGEIAFEGGDCAEAVVLQLAHGAEDGGGDGMGGPGGEGHVGLEVVADEGAEGG